MGFKCETVCICLMALIICYIYWDWMFVIVIDVFVGLYMCKLYVLRYFYYSVISSPPDEESWIRPYLEQL